MLDKNKEGIHVEIECSETGKTCEFIIKPLDMKIVQIRSAIDFIDNLLMRQMMRLVPKNEPIRRNNGKEKN